MTHIEVSFVLPCLNEEKTIAIAIQLCQDAIKLINKDCEIVVADNGSIDNSVSIAEQMGARVVHVKNRGYGNALISGINASYGKYIVMGDADATYDFKETVKFIPLLQNDEADLVIGSRLKGVIEPGAMPFLHRYLGTPVLTFLIRTFFKLPISDCNCGMRAFKKSAFDKLNMISGGMEFASEMLIKAGVIGIRVKEVNCTLSKDLFERTPHLNTWRDGWRHLKFILAFAPKYVFYYPGVFLITLAIILSAMVGFKPVSFGKITMDYNFMYVGLTLFIMGYQLIWLNKFERYFIKFAGYFKNNDETNFSFDLYAKISGLILALGIIIGVLAIIIWKTHLFFASGTNIRLLILSLSCILISFMTFTNALMISMMAIKTNNGKNL